jgi:hypothetical protein
MGARLPIYQVYTNRCIMQIVSNRTVLLFFILLSECCQNCRFGHGSEFYSHGGGLLCAARVESAYAPTTTNYVSLCTIAANKFNYLTAYVSKHSRIVTGMRAIDAHFAFLAFQLMLMLSSSLCMTHMQYN